MSTKDRDVAFLLGLPFNLMTMDETIEDAVAQIDARKPGYYITANADFIAQAYGNEALKDILFHADRVVCDGMPLVWLSRYFKPELPERVAGSDMVFRLFAEARKRGWKIFFLGSDESTLTQTKGILEKEYEGIQIVGTFAPPFGKVDAWPNDEITTMIKESSPDLLLVAVGCPKQEYWISRYYKDVEVPLSIGIGASLDFISGSQTRAPEWIQKIGMEWMWRMLSDPKRLLKRYAKDLYYLGLLSLRQRALLVKRSGDSVGMAFAESQTLSSGERTEVVYHQLSWSGSVEYGSIDEVKLPPNFDRAVLLDTSSVDFIDSSGVGLLAKLAREARQKGVSFALVQPSSVVENVIKAMRLEGQIPVFQNEADALSFIESEAKEFGEQRTERIVKLPPPFGRKENAECLKVLNQAVEDAGDGERLSLDLSELELVDSFAISRFLSAYRQMREKEGQLRLIRLTPQAEQTLRMTGVYGVLVSGRGDG